MLFLGCDGGSTKFAYAVCDDAGRVLVKTERKGVNIFDDGFDTFKDTLMTQVHEVLSLAGVKADDITNSAFGLTGYGESRTSKRDMHDAVFSVLGHERFLLANDSVVGWAGALKCSPGISVVSGTGSVAYGEDGRGGAERAGGWSIRYGDEGSSYWVAVRAINAFFRQADGRMPRTLLYEAFLDKFHVIDPLHFPMALKEYFPNDVAGIAAFQRDVLALYQQGDPCVREIYEQAAKELARLVSALMSRLSFDKSKRVDVSYSGGFFKSGECILLPFRREIEEAGGSLVNPAYGPLAGAISYSARGFLNVETLEKMLGATDAAMQQD